MGTTVFYYMYVYGCYIYPCACKSSGWPFIGLLYKRIHCAKLGWTWSLPFLYHDITSPALTPSPAWMRFLKGGLEKTSNTLLLIYIQFVKVVIKNQISEIFSNYFQFIYSNAGRLSTYFGVQRSWNCIRYIHVYISSCFRATGKSISLLLRINFPGIDR